MFQPPVFREDDPETLHHLMRAAPFATLITQLDGALNADHIPLITDHDAQGRLRLRGHLAAANPLCKQGETRMPALVIFQGAQNYISPGWYESKAQHGKVVPTWNYAVVHARGDLQLIRDPAWLLECVRGLTDQHEENQPQPWQVSDAPEAFVEAQLRAITGVEILVSSLEGKFKVSQNKSIEDRRGVAKALSSQLGDSAPQKMAAMIAHTLKD